MVPRLLLVLYRLAMDLVVEWPLDEARQSLWGFAHAIACDQLVSGGRAEREHC